MRRPWPQKTNRAVSMTCGDVSSCSTSKPSTLPALLILDDLEASVAVVIRLPLQAAGVEQVVAAQADHEILANALFDISFKVAAILLEFLFAEEGAARLALACDS